MRFKIPLIEQLSTATPRKSIIKWLLMTFGYATIIILNDHFEIVQALGFPERLTAFIRLAGVYLYIMLTTHSFSKTPKNENDTYHHQVSTDLENNDQSNGTAPAPGTSIHTPGDQENEPQSGTAHTGTA